MPTNDDAKSQLELMEEVRKLRQEKAKTCDIIREIYHELGGNVGHHFMKVFLERKKINLLKTTIHKYMNREMHLYYVPRRKKPNYKKGLQHKFFQTF